jgi:DNA modification methylase
MSNIQIIQGDCVEKMKELEDNSVDTIITDPPYGLEFMGKDWDKLGASTNKSSYDEGGIPTGRVRYGKIDSSNGFKIQQWHENWAKEALRVAKPGATLMSFGGTRTYHRMACAIEDAGWVIKDCIMWLYGSGFPKATDISKQLDKIIKRIDLFEPFAKHFKEQREIKKLSHKDIAKYFPSKTGGMTGCVWNWENAYSIPTKEQFQVLKDLLDLSDNFISLIERVEEEREIVGKDGRNAKESKFNMGIQKEWNLTYPATPEAKFWNGWKSHGLKPAYEPIIVAMKTNEGSYAENALKWGVSGLNIDGGRIDIAEGDNSGWSGSNAVPPSGSATNAFGVHAFKEVRRIKPIGRFPANIILDEEAGKMLDEQSGMSASRFFYCAKSSRSERNMGCEGIPIKDPDNRTDIGKGSYTEKGIAPQSNSHPTVKPLKLMEYLCLLTKTPTGGIVLDPFMGSGTTGMACKKTGRDFIGIEKEPEYIKIAEARIKNIPIGLI